MSIPIETEYVEYLKSWGIGLEKVYERCRFCSLPTNMWYDKHVPVCPACADKHEINEVSK